MANKYYPSVEYVRQCLRYEDGKLFWLIRPREHFSCDQAWKTWNKRYSLNEAGNLSNVGRKKTNQYNPRWSLVLDYNRYYRCKIVWMLHGREIPKRPLEIDHIDKCNTNDKIDNLRVATRSQQEANKGINITNTSGAKGVFLWKNRFKVSIKVDKKNKSIGIFDTIEEAKIAYAEAGKKYFGEFFRSE